LSDPKEFAEDFFVVKDANGYQSRKEDVDSSCEDDNENDTVHVTDKWVD
jgi:hypothetical protein